MKSQTYNKSYKYPSYWSEDDKIKFDLLVKDSQRYFPEMDEYLINLGCHHYINVEIGKSKEIEPDEIEEYPLDLKKMFLQDE